MKKVTDPDLAGQKSTNHPSGSGSSSLVGGLIHDKNIPGPQLACFSGERHGRVLRRRGTRLHGVERGLRPRRTTSGFWPDYRDIQVHIYAK